MENEALVSVERLKRDIISAATTLSDDEARFLVDAYYMMQDDRKRATEQTRSLAKSAEPNKVIEWLAMQSETLENQIKRALDKYTQAHQMGSWMREVYGIGPVISAGLLAHIDIEKAPTVGHIFSFAGLAPGVEWEKGQKRPWNAQLKTLCWKVGQSFMKFSNEEECVYGHLYRNRKTQEIARNERGGNAEACKVLLEKFKKKDNEAKYWYAGCYKPEDLNKLREANKPLSPENLKPYRLKDGEGLPMLPPAQIDARARRFAVKIFLAHMHAEWYRRHFNKAPPRPYAVDILKHTHEITPENIKDAKFVGKAWE